MRRVNWISRKKNSYHEKRNYATKAQEQMMSPWMGGVSLTAYISSTWALTYHSIWEMTSTSTIEYHLQTNYLEPWRYFMRDQKSTFIWKLCSSAQSRLICYVGGVRVRLYTRTCWISFSNLYVERLERYWSSVCTMSEISSSQLNNWTNALTISQQLNIWLIIEQWTY